MRMNGDGSHLPLLTKHGATVVVLECVIKSAERLFGDEFAAGSRIAPDNLRLLREARDTQIARLRENLLYAKKSR
jgi:hypothetical protein